MLAELLQFSDQEIDFEIDRRAKNKLAYLFPETGELRRELYHKHCSFFEQGQSHTERAFIAGNRTGKTEAGAYEMALHLTGLYPKWWKGYRFKRPTKCWAAGDTAKTVRDVLQEKLLGPTGQRGEGMIPANSIVHCTAKQGMAEAVDNIYVKHVSGKNSVVTLKTFMEGRESFQGTAVDFCWLDESAPEDIYDECLIRLMTTNGRIILTFTPLQGLTPLVLRYLPGGKLPEEKSHLSVTMAGWEDVPHIKPEKRAEMLASIPPHQREARSKGWPTLGSGAIYPIPEDDIAVADFVIPPHWKKVFGLDVGWNRTAAMFAAIDPNSGVTYLYSEHYRGQAEPVVHTQAIHSRGKWIPGVIDPAANGRSQRDGEQLIQVYRDLGLDIEQADNAVEAGIYLVWTLLSSGKLKVFKSLQCWFQEYRLYRRDEKGAIVKRDDHAMDATRYLCMSGRDRAMLPPVAPEPRDEYSELGATAYTGWMD